MSVSTLLKPAVSLLGLVVLGVSDVRAADEATKQQHLEEKPSPTTTLLFGSSSATGSSSGSSGPACVRGHRIVQIPRLDADDVEIVRQLARVRAETEVSRARYFQGQFWLRLQTEAVNPRVRRLVLQLQSERLVLEISQLGFRGDRSTTQPSSLSHSQSH